VKNSLPQLGRKVRCLFDANIKCIKPFEKNQLCFIDTTTEEQYEVTHSFDWHFCPLIPKSKLSEMKNDLEKKGWKIKTEK